MLQSPPNNMSIIISIMVINFYNTNVHLILADNII